VSNYFNSLPRIKGGLKKIQQASTHPTEECWLIIIKFIRCKSSIFSSLCSIVLYPLRTERSFCANFSTMHMPGLYYIYEPGLYNYARCLQSVSKDLQVFLRNIFSFSEAFLYAHPLPLASFSCNFVNYLDEHTCFQRKQRLAPAQSTVLASKKSYKHDRDLVSSLSLIRRKIETCLEQK
jgi:hypothetical protein